MDDQITVRYYAAARAAVDGLSEEQVEVDGPLSEDELFALLAARHPQPPAGELALARVLEESSSFADGVVVLDGGVIKPGQTVDVLPPFAGG